MGKYRVPFGAKVTMGLDIEDRKVVDRIGRLG
jgi:hypothetical protein